jgi:hypothetical protein
MSDQTGQWTLPARGTIQDPQYAPLIPGQPNSNVPYASLNAQILDALRYSGTLPGRPVNPFGGNQVDRYKFGLLNPGSQIPGGPNIPPPTSAGPGGTVGGPPSPTGAAPGGLTGPNNVYTGPPGSFGPKGAGGPNSGLLGGPGGVYGPNTPSNAPALAPAGAYSGPSQSAVQGAMAQWANQPGGSAVADALSKIYAHAGQPMANINAPLSHGGANAGYYQDAQGNYMASNGYGYGTGKAGTPNKAGVFSTDNGLFPTLGPLGQIAASIGPGLYAYLNQSGANPTWTGK